MTTKTLSEIITENGDSAGFSAKDAFWLHISGTFGGGTLTLEFMGANGSWIATTETWTTDSTVKVVTPSVNTTFRFSLGGSTSPSIYIEVLPA
jgi:hypothetical protein